MQTEKLKLWAECNGKDKLREEKIRETKAGEKRHYMHRTGIQTGKDPGNVKWTDEAAEKSKDEIQKLISRDCTPDADTPLPISGHIREL